MGSTLNFLNKVDTCACVRTKGEYTINDFFDQLPICSTTSSAFHDMLVTSDQLSINIEEEKNFDEYIYKTLLKHKEHESVSRRLFRKARFELGDGENFTSLLFCLLFLTRYNTEELAKEMVYLLDYENKEHLISKEGDEFFIDSDFFKATYEKYVVLVSQYSTFYVSELTESITDFETYYLQIYSNETITRYLNKIFSKCKSTEKKINLFNILNDNENMTNHLTVRDNLFDVYVELREEKDEKIRGERKLELKNKRTVYNDVRTADGALVPENVINNKKEAVKKHDIHTETEFRN